MSELNHRRSLIDKHSTLEEQIGILEKVSKSGKENEHLPADNTEQLPSPKVNSESAGHPKSKPVALVPPRMLSLDHKTTLSPVAAPGSPTSDAETSQDDSMPTTSSTSPRRRRGRPRTRNREDSESALQQDSPERSKTDVESTVLQNAVPEQTIVSSSCSGAISNSMSFLNRTTPNKSVTYHAFSALEDRAPIVFPQGVTSKSLADENTRDFLKTSSRLLSVSGKWKPVEQVWKPIDVSPALPPPRSTTEFTSIIPKTTHSAATIQQNSVLVSTREAEQSAEKRHPQNKHCKSYSDSKVFDYYKHATLKSNEYNRRKTVDDDVDGHFSRSLSRHSHPPSQSSHVPQYVNYAHNQYYHHMQKDKNMEPHPESRSGMHNLRFPPPYSRQASVPVSSVTSFYDHLSKMRPDPVSIDQSKKRKKKKSKGKKEDKNCSETSISEANTSQISETSSSSTSDSLRSTLANTEDALSPQQREVRNVKNEMLPVGITAQETEQAIESLRSDEQIEPTLASLGAAKSEPTSTICSVLRSNECASEPSPVLHSPTYPPQSSKQDSPSPVEAEIDHTSGVLNAKSSTPPVGVISETASKVSSVIEETPNKQKVETSDSGACILPSFQGIEAPRNVITNSRHSASQQSRSSSVPPRGEQSFPPTSVRMSPYQMFLHQAQQQQSRLLGNIDRSSESRFAQEQQISRKSHSPVRGMQHASLNQEGGYKPYLCPTSRSFARPQDKGASKTDAEQVPVCTSSKDIPSFPPTASVLYHHQLSEMERQRQMNDAERHRQINEVERHRQVSDSGDRQRQVSDTERLSSLLAASKQYSLIPGMHTGKAHGIPFPHEMPSPRQLNTQQAELRRPPTIPGGLPISLACSLPGPGAYHLTSSIMSQPSSESCNPPPNKKPRGRRQAKNSRAGKIAEPLPGGMPMPARQAGVPNVGQLSSGQHQVNPGSGIVAGSSLNQESSSSKQPYFGSVMPGQAVRQAFSSTDVSRVIGIPSGKPEQAPGTVIRPTAVRLNTPANSANLIRPGELNPRSNMHPMHRSFLLSAPHPGSNPPPGMMERHNSVFARQEGSHSTGTAANTPGSGLSQTPNDISSLGAPIPHASPVNRSALEMVGGNKSEQSVVHTLERQGSVSSPTFPPQ